MSRRPIASFLRQRHARNVRRSAITAAFTLLLVPYARAQTVTPPTLSVAALREKLQVLMAPPGRALPADAAELDRLLLAGDPALPSRLRARSTGAEVATDLNWESSRLYDGAGLLAAYAYMDDLWRLGSASAGATGEDLKGSAAMAFLYAFDLVAVDGVKCTDRRRPRTARIN